MECRYCGGEIRKERLYDLFENDGQVVVAWLWSLRCQTCGDASDSSIDADAGDRTCPARAGTSV
jgi:hypothetical protein